MNNYLNSPILQNLRVKVLNSLCTSGNKQLWLIGPEGRGKTTFINQLLTELNNRKTETYITSYFDFKNAKDYNFQTSLFKFVDSIIGSASGLTHISNSSLNNVFDDLKSRFPKFEQHTNNYFNHLSHSNVNILNTNKKWREMVDYMNKNDSSFEVFWRTCSLTLELLPQSFGLTINPNYNKLQTFLLFVNSIAHRVDVNEVKERSPNYSNLVTGQWAVTYLTECMRSFANHEKFNWILCNDGVEHLFSSPFLNDRGPVFLTNLIFCLQLSKLQSVFIADDSTSALKVADGYYNKALEKDLGSGVESNVNTNIDITNMVFYDMPEMPSDQAISYLTLNIPFPERYIKSVWKITGGNFSLMNKILSDYKSFEQKVSLGTVQQVLSGTSSLVDDEYFPMLKSKDDQLQYLKEEQLKMFIKNLYHDTLNEDIIKFDNSMNEVLSSPSIQKMRADVKNEVHFKVIVYETIRHLLDKKWMRVKSDVKIDNKVMLALLSANILYYQLSTGMLEFKNTLIKYLLRSYIDIDYESFKPMEKIEYKANFLLNQKSLYQDLDKFFV
ncbi:hypothetical protein MACJ_003187 [Theileria orientalis]|uniref:Uncharacterized protein n=1 Tax=Theileria orientalis TaxID=68886 RepID=A0A976M9T8_THEOR|nr:hypothetical protein MACJ_003187 [Theileria orientalis]